jgi:hypothetical protein
MQNLSPTDAARTVSATVKRSPYAKGADRLASDLERTNVKQSRNTPLSDTARGLLIVGGEMNAFAQTKATEGREGKRDSERVIAALTLLDAAPALLEACKADVHDLEEIRLCVNDLSGDSSQKLRAIDLIDGRLFALRATVAKAEGKAKP